MTAPDNTTSPEARACLDNLDQLIADLGEALATQDWDTLARLNARVKPLVEPAMAALEAGEAEPAQVQSRLEALRRYADAASEGATRARAEAEAALKGVSRNRNAARMYQDISTTRPK